MRLLRGVLVMAVLATTAVGGAPAVASCAGEPVRSPHAFTGTVLYTAHEDRWARVLADTGHLVTVMGSPDLTVVTSVDRTYIAGVRYEFHPLNARPLYHDNACTATRPLSY